MSGRIVWCCDECGDTINDGDGHLYISVGEAVQRADAHREWESAWRGKLIPLGAFLDLPPRASWRVTHQDCDFDGLVSYAIGVERAATAGQLLAWTLHLQEKNWYSSTDWADFLRTRVAITTSKVTYA